MELWVWVQLQQIVFSSLTLMNYTFYPKLYVWSIIYVLIFQNDHIQCK